MDKEKRILRSEGSIREDSKKKDRTMTSMIKMWIMGLSKCQGEMRILIPIELLQNIWAAYGVPTYKTCSQKNSELVEARRDWLRAKFVHIGGQEIAPLTDIEITPFFTP